MSSLRLLSSTGGDYADSAVTVVPAGSACAPPSGCACDDALRRLEKRGAKRAAELVPGRDVLRRRRTQPVGIGWRVGGVHDPAVELRLRHLGMELHAPA